jgi:hypothetical protein
MGRKKLPRCEWDGGCDKPHHDSKDRLCPKHHQQLGDMLMALGLHPTLTQIRRAMVGKHHRRIEK